jgi:hypothetical protein
MRTIVAVGVVSLAALLVYSAAGDEKQRRAELEKELAKLEPDLEKEEWAVKRKQFIAELTNQLEKAERVDLLRINPLPKDGNAEKMFHGHAVLSEVRVTSKDQRKKVAGFVGKTLHWNEGRTALCFEPNHGMRVVSGDKTTDFLICFSCNRVRIFEGDKQVAALPLAFTDKDNPVEKCLTESEKQGKDKK